MARLVSRVARVGFQGTEATALPVRARTQAAEEAGVYWDLHRRVDKIAWEGSV